MVEILDGCLLFPTTWPASLALAPAPRLRPPMVWKLGGGMKGGGRVGGIDRKAIENGRRKSLSGKSKIL